MPAYTLTIVADSDTGLNRELNEDSVLGLSRQANNTPCGLAVVADGMGGHQAGEIASRIAVETMHQQLAWLLERDPQNDTAPLSATPPSETPQQIGDDHYLARRLRLAIKGANQAIINHAHQNPIETGNMGSTITAALIYGQTAVVANIGDSRAYLFRQNELIQISEDHSYVGRLVRLGQLTRDQARIHPRRNLITRTLGSDPEVDIDVWLFKLLPDDKLLLCSDGLWEMVADENMIAERLAQPPASAIPSLIQLANDFGGHDNIGVVITHLVESS
ncbi:MAG TPA: Stp1/IreP family PP2C-type Ser/Thr phosphatase [Anaerolineae bacterium]|nr:Stp1/IreP family PP2C-type Ser/Thr phosphatase [Anaerolineae bacterium]